MTLAVVQTARIVRASAPVSRSVRVTTTDYSSLPRPVRETPDQIIVRLAASTAGVVTRASLLANGVSGTSIQRRLDTGFLAKPCRGVYVCDALQAPATRLWVPLLAMPNSVLSRQTAAQLHGLKIANDGRVHVTTTKGASWRLADIVVHETRLPVAEDVVAVEGMRATSKARTLFDCAAITRRQAFRHALNDAVTKDAALADQFVACFRSLARSGVTGVRMIRTVLDDLGDEPMEESELERLVWLGLAAHRIDGFRRQYRPAWFDGIRGTVDFADPVARVILEADGRRWHAAEQAMSDDRRRDRRAVSEGWVVLRVSWNEITHRPAATFAEIGAVVAARSRPNAA